jgi:hypothetical protein
MTSENINIYGVKFTGPEMPVMASEDGRVMIMKNDAGKFVSFSFSNSSLGEYAKFLSNFNIEILGLTNHSLIPLRHDFSKISIDSLEKIFFELSPSDTIIFSQGKQIFKKLKEISIRGSFPLQMPLADSFPKLIKLTIELTSDYALEWLKGFDDIIDMIIYKFPEKNLKSLASLKNIRRLCLVECDLTSLDGIETFPCLTTLHVVACNKLSKIQSLLQSNSIQYIMFEKFKKIKNWDVLAQKKNLKSIWLEIANDVNFVRELPNLEYFKCLRISNGDESPIKERRLINLPHRDGIFYTPVDELGSYK